MGATHVEGPCLSTLHPLESRAPVRTGIVLAKYTAVADGCAKMHQPVPYTAHSMQLKESPLLCSIKL